MFNNQNDKPPERGPRPSLQGGRPNGVALVFFLVMAGLFAAYFFRSDSTPVREIRYSDFTRFVEQNQIESVTIHDNDTMDIFIRGSSSQEPAQMRTRIPYADPNLLSSLREKNINISGAAARPNPWRVAMELLPWFIGCGFIWFMFRNL
ncbi:MAG: ATP-dependent metallopeptidase FtsH/Yme1/Tma family protein, partial [Spirochaetaceae bacterium]|nr:ATP-dependent metallopeptidase FtsH/Yme1/Tma family protein [Spirochaetaceae bacterium]